MNFFWHEVLGFLRWHGVRWSIVLIKSIGAILLGSWWWCTTVAFIVAWQYGVYIHPGISMLIIGCMIHASLGLWPFRWVHVWIDHGEEWCARKLAAWRQRGVRP